jgi:hypothetical protein
MKSATDTIYATYLLVLANLLQTKMQPAAGGLSCDGPGLRLRGLPTAASWDGACTAMLATTGLNEGRSHRPAIASLSAGHTCRERREALRPIWAKKRAAAALSCAGTIVWLRVMVICPR